ncbi:MAG: phosphopantetheine-binding protein [Paenibacillaceae bacterium]
MNTNGKINKNQLPQPSDRGEEDNRHASPPRNELDMQLKDVWMRVLDVQDIGIFDDFFAIGGHSLLVVKLEVELEKEGFDCEDLDIFKHNTIFDLSEYFAEKQNGYS